MKILQNSLKWQSRTAKQAKGHLLLKFARVCVRERDSLKISFMCKCSCLYLFVHGRICAWGTEQCSSACWVIRWHSGLERKRHIHMNTHTHTDKHAKLWLNISLLHMNFIFKVSFSDIHIYTCTFVRKLMDMMQPLAPHPQWIQFFFLFAHTYNTVTSFKYEWIR